MPAKRGGKTSTTARELPKGAEAKPLLIRLQKDLEELQELASQGIIKLEIPDPNDMQHFKVSIMPKNGLYRGKWFDFDFSIPDQWPNVAPVVIILNDIWHPNIQLTKDGGHVCVSVLRKAYTPSLLLTGIVTALTFLLTEPNPHDALNIDAAQMWLTNYPSFQAKAQDYLSKMGPEEEIEDF